MCYELAAPSGCQLSRVVVLPVCNQYMGQGDSILMSTSGDTHVLVDAGQPWAGPTVVAYLQTEGIEHIDVVVMSHGHADHIGGLIALFQSDISVGSVVYNGQPCTTTTCTTVWAEMEKRNLTPTPAVASQTHTWGDLDVEILNPQLVLAPTQDVISVRLGVARRGSLHVHLRAPGDGADGSLAALH